jgi:hypothetical protein
VQLLNFLVRPHAQSSGATIGSWSVRNGDIQDKGIQNEISKSKPMRMRRAKRHDRSTLAALPRKSVLSDWLLFVFVVVLAETKIRGEKKQGVTPI